MDDRTRTNKEAEADAFVAKVMPDLEAQARAFYRRTHGEGSATVSAEDVAREHGLGDGRILLEAHRAIEAATERAKAVPCPCGGMAEFVGRRPAMVTTTVGRLSFLHPYYLCPTCRRGHCPFDARVGICAGGLSRELTTLLARHGAELPFADAVRDVQHDLFVSVSPTVCEPATRRLGAAWCVHEARQVGAAFRVKDPLLPPVGQAMADVLYVGMDGVLTNTRTQGWKEVKLAAIYTTKMRKRRKKRQEGTKRPETMLPCTVNSTDDADMAEPTEFGRGVWLEAARRGVLTARRVVVLGDGAHWIWILADEHFPTAIQILDWSHATAYVWLVAGAVYGEGSDVGKQWAANQLQKMWDGEIAAVIAACGQVSTGRAGAAEAVHKAVTYFTNNTARMNSPAYRAAGLQIGSGTIESGGKHVIGARMKQSGMRWDIDGAREVAKVRSWLKGGRWAAAATLAPTPIRHRTEQAA